MLKRRYSFDENRHCFSEIEPEPIGVIRMYNLLYFNRVRKGLTQQALAELAGISRRTVCRLESSGGYPSYASAAAIILFVIVLTITCINLLISKKHVHY